LEEETKMPAGQKIKLVFAIFLPLIFWGVFGILGQGVFPQPAAEAAPFDDQYVPAVRATVEKITPSAWIERSGRRFELNIGSRIQEFDSVMTGDGGSVTIKFIDSTVIELSPYSELAILDVSHAPKSSRFAVSLARGGALVNTGGIGLRNSEGVNIATPKGIVKANDAVVWIGVGGGEEVVRIEDMTRGPKVSVYNSTTSNLMITTSSRYGIVTDAANVMHTVELAPR
jgi:hypothetical protein